MPLTTEDRVLTVLPLPFFVRIAGRKRELILRGGYSVFPGEVEGRS